MASDARLPIQAFLATLIVLFAPMDPAEAFTKRMMPQRYRFEFDPHAPSTASYGASPDLSMTPRQALASEIRDVRRIYLAQGFYTRDIRQSLLDVIRQNRAAWPGQF